MIPTICSFRSASDVAFRYKRGRKGSIRGKDLKYWDIHFQFSRAIPKDLSYLADVVTKLKGIVSDRTLISLMPFVDDVDFEFEQREEELTSTYGQLYNELPDTASQLPNASE